MADQVNENREGPKLTGKALKQAKRAMRRRVLPHLQEKRKDRSRQRRADRAANVSTEQAIEDYPIAKGGRCGRPQMEEVFKAVQEGNSDHIRAVLQNFDKLPQSE